MLHWCLLFRCYTSSFVGLYNGVTKHKPRTKLKLITAGPQQQVVGLHGIGMGMDEILQVHTATGALFPSHC